MYTIKELQEVVAKAFENENFIKEPQGLYQPIKYTLDNGGKRLRPVLVLMAYNLFADDVEKAIKPAMGMEIFHNFTLLHDDIMDHADMRRNLPTVHKKWDENTAILSGDAMFIKAYDYIFENESPNFKDIIKLFNRTALEVCEGQQYDMEFEDRDNVAIEEYMEMIRLKTSVLIAASLKIGALLAAAPKQDADLLYDFGIKIGLGFQLQDDYLDVYGDPAVFGKKIGGDILSNKKTFLMIKARELAKQAGNNELEEWIEKKDFDKTEKIKAVTEIYNKLKVAELSRDEINAYHKASVESLTKVSVDENKKQNLYDFAKTLVDRVK